MIFVKSIVCPNGSICECIWEDASYNLGIIFSAIEYRETVLAIPLCSQESRKKEEEEDSISLEFNGSCYFVNPASVQRLEKGNILSLVGLLDYGAMECILKSLFSQMQGTGMVAKISSVPKEEEPRVPVVYNRYTEEDYEFILEHFPGDLEEVRKKYNLKDRQAVYRLKYALKHRFGKMDTEDKGEIVIAEGGVTH